MLWGFAHEVGSAVRPGKIFITGIRIDGWRCFLFLFSRSRNRGVCPRRFGHGNPNSSFGSTRFGLSCVVRTTVIEFPWMGSLMLFEFPVAKYPWSCRGSHLVNKQRKTPSFDSPWFGLSCDAFVRSIALIARWYITLLWLIHCGSRHPRELPREQGPGIQVLLSYLCSCRSAPPKKCPTSFFCAVRNTVFVA